MGWLDFTHAITFTNALRRLSARVSRRSGRPGLLQMACFLGRSAPSSTGKTRRTAGSCRASPRCSSRAIDRIFDHGEPDYIHSAHLVKTFLAAEEEIDAGLPPETTSTLLAAVNRYIPEPPKRRHIRRVAHQAMEFVALED